MAEPKKGKPELVLGGLLVAGAGGYLLWYLYHQKASVELIQQVGLNVTYSTRTPSYHEQVEAKITLTNRSSKAMRVVVKGESYISGTNTRVGRFFADKTYAALASQAFEARREVYPDQPWEVTLGPGETKTHSMWTGQIATAAQVCGRSPCWLDVQWKINEVVARLDRQVIQVPG